MKTNSNEKYHFIQVVHFSPGKSISVRGLRRIWARLARFGNLDGHGSFSIQGAFKTSDNRKLVLGDLSCLSEFNENTETVVGGGVFYVSDPHSPIFNCDLHFSLSTIVPRNGAFFPRTLKIAISNLIADQIEPDSLAAFFDAVFADCDAVSSYGFVDVAAASEAWAGIGYGAMPSGGLSIRQKVEMNAWVHCRSRSVHPVRSLYWGNFFTGETLEKLGGKAAFASRYHEATKKLCGSPSAVIREHAFGVFCTLALNPRSARPSPGFDVDMLLDGNLLWLQAELGKHGILERWDGDIAGAAQASMTSG